eukprot:9325151-Karenia_brevis.AAC.1
MAQELIHKANMLQREDVEVGIPDEVVEEAGSQMSAGSSSRVQEDSSMADDEGAGVVPGGEAREREYEADDNRSETSE